MVDWLPLPGGGTLALTPDQETALTILLVVVTINAVNFIDGLDGLATGIVGIGAAAFYLYYYTLAKRLGLSEQTDPALASAVLAGVAWASCRTTSTGPGSSWATPGRCCSECCWPTRRSPAWPRSTRTR